MSIIQRLKEMDVWHEALSSRFSGVFLIAWGVLMLVSIENLSAAQDAPLIHEQEISHLLNFIENSGCVFIRNNKEYDSKRARDHISTKYDYIKKKEPDISAEQASPLFLKSPIPCNAVRQLQSSVNSG